MPIHSIASDNDVSCYIPSYCTAVDACVHVPIINRNINAHLRLKPCDSVMEVGIEQFKFQIGLFEYVFGIYFEIQWGIKNILILKCL